MSGIILKLFMGFLKEKWGHFLRVGRMFVATGMDEYRK